MKIKTYTSTGTKTTPITSPKTWKGEVNTALISQAIRVYEDNLHVGSSVTKTRSEVSGSTRKIYRQKGTGGARHGARTAPIFVGGSKAHGPKQASRTLNLPSKMREKALVSALISKINDDRLVAVKTINKLTKTKQAHSLITKIQKDLKITKSSNRVTVVLPVKSEARRIFRNLENVEILDDSLLNAYNVFFGGLLIFDEKSLTK